MRNFVGGMVFGALIFGGVALAAPGDFLVVEASAPVVLSAAQRTTLGNLVSTMWAGALADVRSVTCMRVGGTNSIECSVRGVRPIAPASVSNLPVCTEGRVP